MTSANKLAKGACPGMANQVNPGARMWTSKWMSGSSGRLIRSVASLGGVLAVDWWRQTSPERHGADTARDADDFLGPS